MYDSFSALSISASGLSAERLRMEVTANNIANANTTMTSNGDPYRRQDVVFSAFADGPQGGISGVHVVGVQPDPSPFRTVHRPDHPHAGQDDMLRLPNVEIPNEMIDLISASRSYEANLRSITLYKEMVEETLSLLNGGR